MEETEQLSDLSSDSSTSSDAASPITETASETTDTTSKPEDTFDLEKVAKFRYAGKEYTLDDFKKGWMKNEDYTKKTQALAEARKTFEKEQSYRDNLEADLENVKRDPSLVGKFMEVYPEKFHRFLKFAVKEEQINQQRQQFAKDPRLDGVIEFVEQQKTEAAEKEINYHFDALVKKYPDADELSVIQKCQIARQNSEELNPKLYEQYFKESHDRIQKLVKDRQSLMFKNQKTANAASKGPGKGGGIAGQAPKVPRNIKEATAALMDSNEF